MAKLGESAGTRPRAIEKQKEIEEQVRSWSARLEFAGPIGQETTSNQITAEINPYIAVSREAGAGGREVIQYVSNSLEFDIVDKEMLDYLAERYQLPRDMLEIVDERASNWLTEAIGMWLAHRMVSQSDYLQLLARFVLMAAHNTNAIFAGRGVQFTLPRDKGLAVRIVAPRDQRVACIMDRQQMSRDEAERYLTKRDAGRRDFIRCHFRQDVTNPILYDLIINTENISCDCAAEIIVDEWRKRFGN